MDCTDGANIELTNETKCCGCCCARKIKKKPTPYTAVKDHARQYCSATSIHGVQYLGEEGRPISERIWWIVIFIISFCGNSYLVRQVWIKWNTSPVILTFSENTTPVWKVPFPVVTICPKVTYRKSIFPFTDTLSGNSRDWLEEAGYISLLCENDDITVEGNRTTDADLIKFYRKVGLPFNDTFTYLEWGGEQINNDVLTEIATEDGICYSFNILDISDRFRSSSILPTKNRSRVTNNWDMEKGYFTNHIADDYPNRAMHSGIAAGLTVVMSYDNDDFDYYCQGVTPGFKVTLSGAGEMPSIRDKYFMVEPDKEVLAGIDLEMITTSDSLTSYLPEVRKCYFSSERYLMHFKIYSQRNCEFECLSNYTLIYCDCVPFYMPRKNLSVPVCGPLSKNCTEKVKEFMRLYETALDGLGEGCDCLPACTSTKYKLDVTQQQLDWKRSSYTEQIPHDENPAVSKVTVYFSEKQYFTSERRELYGLVDFLANCGGLIGLFSGFSVLSIVEIIYFLTLRCWNTLKKRHDTEKQF